MPSPKIDVFPEAESLARGAADRIASVAATAIAERGRFTVALAGGSTPRRTYQLLASREFASRVDWCKVFVFLGDERWTPIDDERSNFALAADALLRHVPIPFGNVFPVMTHTPSAAASAAKYADAVKGFFQSVGESTTRFDLSLLGLGDDGHTASLFPGQPSLAATEATFIASPPGVLPPPVDRITATMPLINASRAAMFLVAGGKKQQVVWEILQGDPANRRHYPAAAVNPTDGQLIWLLDAAAAGKLSKV